MGKRVVFVAMVTPYGGQTFQFGACAIKGNEPSVEIRAVLVPDRGEIKLLLCQTVDLGLSEKVYFNVEIPETVTSEDEVLLQAWSDSANLGSKLIGNLTVLCLPAEYVELAKALGLFDLGLDEDSGV